MSGAGGGVISGAELNKNFDEESQFYPEDSDIKYMEDRCNCRKKIRRQAIVLQVLK